MIFLWGRSQNFERVVINVLKKQFKVGSQSSGAFKYIGLDVKQTKDAIVLSQES